MLFGSQITHVASWRTASAEVAREAAIAIDTMPRVLASSDGARLWVQAYEPDAPARLDHAGAIVMGLAPDAVREDMAVGSVVPPGDPKSIAGAPESGVL